MKEIPLKQWFNEQAARERSTYAAVVAAYYRGMYPKLKLRRVNARVVWVTE